MLYISHRGNIEGKNIERENSPEYIIETIKKGYDVEVDIWYKNDNWYFGHDYPMYNIELDDFKEHFSIIWFHCKNLEALYEIRKYNNVCYFWHENDSYTLTSNNFIWTYPNKKLSKISICVLPEISNYTETEISNTSGICSDYIYLFKNIKLL